MTQWVIPRQQGNPVALGGGRWAVVSLHFEASVSRLLEPKSPGSQSSAISITPFKCDARFGRKMSHGGSQREEKKKKTLWFMDI